MKSNSDRISIEQSNKVDSLFSEKLENNSIRESTSELFSEVIESKGILNIQGHELSKRDCFALESLLQKVVKKQIKVLEIGSWKGMATAVMGGVISDYEGTLFAIDSWKGSTSVPSMVKEAADTDIFKIFNENMRILGLADRVVKPIVMESLTAVNFFQDNTFDFIFIDGNHSYSSIKQDILAWLPKLKGGGIICGSCAEGYYSQYSETVQAKIDEKCEVDYIKIEDVGVHPGVVKALYEVFDDRYEIMPRSSLWYYQKTAIDSQWLIDSSKPNKLNPSYAAHVKILLNILGETTQEEPNRDNIYQIERISRVARYCTQGWIGDLIQLGYPSKEVTKKLAELAQQSNRRLVVVNLAEVESQDVTSQLEEIFLEELAQYADVVSVINSKSFTEETIESIQSQAFCFAFLDGFETYEACITALKTVSHCSGVIALDRVLNHPEMSRAFVKSSESIAHRSKLYLPGCQEAYLLWP